jgi:hypothetical protein
MKDDGGPAFPWEDVGGLSQNPAASSGMTLRDWFAGMALTTQNHPGMDLPDCPQRAAQLAYELADAMIKARSK